MKEDKTNNNIIVTSSKDFSKGIVPVFLYYYIFNGDPKSAADRAVTQSLPRLKTCSSREKILSALDQILQEKTQLSDLLPQKHSEDELITFLEIVRNKLQSDIEID